MYSINDMIIYGNSGVCKVMDICTPEIPGAVPGRLYYILQPVYHNEKIYTPVDTDVFMRSIITAEEAQKLIDHISTLNDDILLNEDNQEIFEEHYKALWQTHDCTNLIKLIKALYFKKKSTVSLGKKFCEADERNLDRAEDALYSEFSTALNMSKEQMKNDVVKIISQVEKK